LAGLVRYAIAHHLVDIHPEAPSHDVSGGLQPALAVAPPPLRFPVAVARAASPVRVMNGPDVTEV